MRLIDADALKAKYPTHRSLCQKIDDEPTLPKIHMIDTPNGCAVKRQEAERFLSLLLKCCDFEIPQSTFLQMCEAFEGFSLSLQDGFVAVERYEGEAKNLVVPAMFYDHPVEAIKSQAFTKWGCPELESVVILNGIEYIGDEAFYSCTELKSVTLPSRFKGRTDLFIDCPNLKEIIYTEDE